ncbi:hypothetical protein MBLNU457_1418t1 [Dothideomycetes sp. NU457]
MGDYLNFFSIPASIRTDGVIMTRNEGAVLVALLAGLAAFFYYVFGGFHEDEIKKRNQRDPSLPPPSEVIGLRVYPIKSCRGIEVDRVRITKQGLDLDRNWMFIDAEKKKFLTIRAKSNMTLINTKFSDDHSELIISITGSDEEVRIATRPTQEWLKENCTLDQAEIWEGPTDVWLYGDDVNAMFSKHLGKQVKLAYKGPTPRLAGGSASTELYGKETSFMFADLMHVQIASEASLQDLNRRLLENKADCDQLTIERFRPNIIIKGNEPWEEDRWKKVQIVVLDHAKERLWRYNFDVVCRCARCHVPDVHPDTGVASKKFEPYKTLMTFRNIDMGGPAAQKPCFGMLCIPQNEGEIWVGNKLEALEMTDKHLYNTTKFSDL